MLILINANGKLLHAHLRWCREHRSDSEIVGASSHGFLRFFYIASANADDGVFGQDSFGFLNGYSQLVGLSVSN